MGEATGSSKVAKGSAIILIGNVIFRVGGYLYRFLMASLLGPAAYGILGLTTPFQGIFQVLSAAGLPPAIAKYVSEYNALDEEDLARQTVFTALKIMVFLGFFFGLVMVFVAAPIITNYYHKPEALLPLQAVGLITPFSVIVGAFRGAFQGVYKMEYILYTRAIEQIFMILFATALVILGLSTFGAVLGSVLGFAASAVLGLAKRLLFFSIPVTVTALAEMGIYSICTLLMGGFLAASAIGYFTAADPISRLPLIISSSLATTILPAASEAYALKDQNLLEKYVNASYKYGMFFVIPMCVGIAIFAKEIMGLVYFTNSAYMNGAMSLAILVIGMTFYSIYTISGSIVQGIGNPRIPMYLLIFGCIITLGLGWYLIPTYGIEGGALATTIASFIMMIPMFLLQFRLTKTHAPYSFLTKVTIASLIMALPVVVLPNNSYGLIAGLIICPIIYMIAIVALRTLSHDDVAGFRKFTRKLGPLRKYANKLLDIIDKYSSK